MSRDDYTGITVFITKRLVLILLAGLIGLALAVLYTYFLTTPVYEGSVTLHISKIDDAYGYLNTDEFNVYNRMIADSEDMMKSRELFKYMTDETGYTGSFKEFSDSITLGRKIDSNVFRVNFSSGNAKEASDFANIFAEKVIQIMEREFVQAKVSLINRATPEDKPVSPSYIVNAAVGFITGILICMVFFIFFYIFSDYIKNESDLRKIIDKQPVIRLKSKNSFVYKHILLRKKNVFTGRLRLVSSIDNKILGKLDKDINNILTFCSADSAAETNILPVLLSLDMTEKGRFPIILSFREGSIGFIKKACNYKKGNIGDFLSKKRHADRMMKEITGSAPLLLDFSGNENTLGYNEILKVIERIKEKEKFTHIMVIAGDVGKSDNSFITKNPGDYILFVVTEGKTKTEELKSLWDFTYTIPDEMIDIVYYN